MITPSTYFTILVKHLQSNVDRLTNYFICFTDSNDFQFAIYKYEIFFKTFTNIDIWMS